MIDGVDRFGFIFLHVVNLWPIGSSLSVPAWFIFSHPLPAFLLSVSLNFAKVAVFAIPVAVVSVSGIASSVESGLIASASGVEISSVLSTGLIVFGSGPSSVESCDVVVFLFIGIFLLSEFVDQGWAFALELALGCGCYLVHSFNGDGLLLLLGYDRSEFWRECRFEKVHLEEVDPHGVVLSQEPPESVVGNSSIDVVVRVRDFGVVFVDDSCSPCDAGE